MDLGYHGPAKAAASSLTAPATKFEISVKFSDMLESGLKT